MVPVETVALQADAVGDLGGGLGRGHRHPGRQVREHRRARHPVPVKRLRDRGADPGHGFSIDFRDIVQPDQHDTVRRDSGRRRKQHGLAEACLEAVGLGPLQQRTLEAPVKVSTAGGKLAAFADGDDNRPAPGQRRLDET